MSHVFWMNYKRTPMEVITQRLFFSFYVIFDELYIDNKKVLTVYKRFALSKKQKKITYYYVSSCLASVLNEVFIIVTVKPC